MKWRALADEERIVNEIARAVCSDGAMTVEKASEFSGIGRTKLYEAMTEGLLAYIKVGTRRLIPKAALVQFLAGRLTGGTTDACSEPRQQIDRESKQSA